MIVSAWLEYFEYVSYLLHGITLIVLNFCLDLITITSTGLPDLGAWSSKKAPERNFANHFWHIWLVTAPSPYTAQIFVCVCVCVFCIFTFFEIIKHNMLKMLLFSSIFSISMATQKFTNFYVFFFKHTLIWQLSQYKLTTVLRMKLKATKCC